MYILTMLLALANLAMGFYSASLFIDTGDFVFIPMSLINLGLGTWLLTDL